MVKHLEGAYMLYSEITESPSLKGFMEVLEKYENTRSGREMILVFKKNKQEKQFIELLTNAFKAWCTGRGHFRVSHYMVEAETILKEFINNQKKVA